jgi:hypothetical protein
MAQKKKQDTIGIKADKLPVPRSGYSCFPCKYRVFQKELYNFQISNAGALAVAVLGTTVPRA